LSHRKDFEECIRTLNAQLWVLLILCEHSAGQFSQMPSLDGLPHEKVIPAIFHYSKTHSPRLRLRNDSLTTDMVELTKQTEKWLPAYFLILAKSIAEGIFNDLLTQLYNTDAAIKAKINIKRRGKHTQTKQIEILSQAITRGSFGDVNDVIDIEAKLPDHANISRVLNSYSKIRNKMAHNLNGQYRSKGPITVDELKNYIKNIQDLVIALT